MAENFVLDSTSLPAASPLQSSEEQPLDAWCKIQRRLKERLDEQIFAAWIKPLRSPSVSFSHQESSGRAGAQTAELVITAPHKFAAEHLKNHYSAIISEAAARVLEVENVLVSFGVEKQPPHPKPSLAARTVKEVISQTVARSAKESNLNPDYNFSNFVVGGCNQFAHAVSLQVSENLGTAFNPLFLYGGVGLGKTHLANAIGNAARRRGKNVLLVSSESFVNELITALRSNRMQQFKSRFRSLDLLIVDDVQFIIGKERTQEEFFHTFNELHQRKRQIILTSDRLPAELVGLEERLKTRFASGVSADLQTPDFETRVAILCKKSESVGVTIPREVAELIAEHISTNIRELEGALNKLVAMSSLHERPLSLDLAREALRGHIPQSKPAVSIELVQRAVAERFSVSLNDLLGKRRSQHIALARQAAMYLSRRLTGCSFPEIGALFGGRDHSTVIHAIHVVEERLSNDDSFKKAIDDLLETLSC